MCTSTTSASPRATPRTMLPQSHATITRGPHVLGVSISPARGHARVGCRRPWHHTVGLVTHVPDLLDGRLTHIYAPLCIRAIVEETRATPSGVPSSSIGGRDPSAGAGVCNHPSNHELASNPTGLPDCSTIERTCASSVAIAAANSSSSQVGPWLAGSLLFGSMMPRRSAVTSRS